VAIASRSRGCSGFEAEVLAEAAAVKKNVERSRGFGGAAVGRRGADRSKEGGDAGGLVVDHNVDAVRR